jgi:hypothetical protein
MKSITRKLLWSILSLIVFSVQAYAQEMTFDDSVLSPDGKKAYQELLKIDTFAIGGVGYGGVTSKGEEALIILLKEKEAVSALKALTEYAVPEGGLYGLFGLKVLKCDCFNEEFEKFINKPESGERESRGRIKVAPGEAITMSGCLIFSEKKVKIAEEIGSGEFDSYINQHFK